MDLPLLALAFTLSPWSERQKAEAWAAFQAGVTLPHRVRHELDRLGGLLPRLRAEAAQRGARLMLPGDAGVDPLLTPLPYPVALWVRGSLPPDSQHGKPIVAIVGSRQASFAGLERTRSWARELTAGGLAVLSGLARGIDGAAHEGALQAGATWGVLGSGLDHPYPAEHGGLMDRMVAAGGGVLTPFPPEAPPLPANFPRRNVLLAAWSHGVLVVEAKLRSGSLVTAKLALDHGKELFAVPGSEGTDALLAEGAAHRCESVEGLIEQLPGW